MARLWLQSWHYGFVPLRICQRADLTLERINLKADGGKALKNGCYAVILEGSYCRAAESILEKTQGIPGMLTTVVSI